MSKQPFCVCRVLTTRQLVVIFLLLVLLLVLLFRRRRRAPEAYLETHLKPLSQQPSHTTMIVEDETDEDDESTRFISLVPPLLRPGSVSLSSPRTSMRSSTLYAFSSMAEQHGSHTADGPQKVDSKRTGHEHRTSVSTTTLPNPYSEHCHAAESPQDVNLPSPIYPSSVASVSVYSPTRTNSAHPSWREATIDTIDALDREPTPISRRSTASTARNESVKEEYLHRLLLHRQKNSETPLLGDDREAFVSTGA